MIGIRPGNHRRIDPFATRGPLELEELLVVEEQLRHEEIRACVDLLFEVGQIGAHALRFDVFLRIARGADAKIVVALEHRDQLGRVGEAAGRRDECGFTLRRVAAQREDVLNAGAGEIVEERSQLGARRSDARDVSDDGQADFVLNLLGERDGAGPRRTAGAVRNRHERRSQGDERLDRREELLRAGVVLWVERTRTRKTAGRSRACR